MFLPAIQFFLLHSSIAPSFGHRYCKTVNYARPDRMANSHLHKTIFVSFICAVGTPATPRPELPCCLRYVRRVDLKERGAAIFHSISHHGSPATPFDAILPNWPPDENHCQFVGFLSASEGNRLVNSEGVVNQRFGDFWTENSRVRWEPSRFLSEPIRLSRNREISAVGRNRRKSLQERRLKAKRPAAETLGAGR